MNQARSEVATREAAAAEQTPPATEETPEAQPEVAPKSEPTPLVPEDVATLLNNPRPLAEFSDDELKIRIGELREAAGRAELPASARQRLRKLQTHASREAATRKAAATQQGAEPSSPDVDNTADQQAQPGLQPEAVRELPNNAVALLGDTRPLAELRG